MDISVLKVSAASVYRMGKNVFVSTLKTEVVVLLKNVVVANLQIYMASHLGKE
jgi:hypothetical protein